MGDNQATVWHRLGKLASQINLSPHVYEAKTVVVGTKTQTWSHHCCGGV